MHDGLDADVIVVGGGPAGATAATLLATRGVETRVLEKARFPRFHIGESLLPVSVPTLIGMSIDVEGPAFRYKDGAEFFDEATGDYARYPFGDAMPGGPGPGHAYHVERELFDQALLDAARAGGAHVSEGERVLRVDPSSHGVRVDTEHGTYRCRYCIDATGQDAFFARRDRTTTPIDDFGRAAVFTHFDDVGDEALDLLGPDGNIKVLMRSDGWSWIIPLPGRRVSVGTVTRRGTVTPAVLDDAIEASGMLRTVASGAERGRTEVVRNFSYRNTSDAGARYACIGDAACFLDPVFSSGVALALLGAEGLVRELVPALNDGREANPDLAAPSHRRLVHAYTCLSALIHGFYHTKIVKNLFFARRPDPEMRAGLITMLTGDLWREDNPFQNALLASKRRLAPVV